ncbi:uncharacterized protein METZ01_LOCUS341042 [marine metagenome]|uniref:Methyltransferase domain-containing protein n=1 Tax=marine metagenome TaxID=408172 RepID=A0A382QTF6_9ZZZZ
MISLAGYRRQDVLSLLQGERNVGVELGVAEGVFSKHMQESGKFENIIGIDSYSEQQHNTEEYKLALKKMGLMSNYQLLRMTFDDAVELFDDLSLNFVYVDGYAHSGENGGKTIFDWYKKVKVGGILAGDDYHADWPLVIEAVDQLIQQTGYNLQYLFFQLHKKVKILTKFGLIH